jgi:hypothetical protein
MSELVVVVRRMSGMSVSHLYNVLTPQDRDARGHDGDHAAVTCDRYLIRRRSVTDHYLRRWTVIGPAAA